MDEKTIREYIASMDDETLISYVKDELKKQRNTKNVKLVKKDV
jgi:hypothetical protein